MQTIIDIDHTYMYQHKLYTIILPAPFPTLQTSNLLSPVTF